MSGGSAPSFYNYGDMSHLGATTWDFCNAAPTTSIFSLPSTLSPLSDSSVYSTTESDLLLVSSDSDEFLQQINGSCSPITMHPNLVHTLKNMMAPGAPVSVVPGGGSGTMYSAQLSVLDQLEQLNRMAERHQEQQHETGQIHNIHDTGRIHDGFVQSAMLRQYCSPSLGLKAELADLSPPLGIMIPYPVVTEEPLKAVEKSETEENIEAAVVSVDLIKNKRPFKCQHDGCDKTFKNPQTMKMHHKTHYSDGSAGSNGCALPTLTSSLKAGHNKKTPSRCPKCKKTFVGLYELRRHYGRKHSEGKKPFGCSKCGKEFYIEVDVRDHEKLCGNPMECKCGLKFAFKCNLVAHKKAHPACQDQQQRPFNSTSSYAPTTSTNQSSSSDDSGHSLTNTKPPTSRTGSKRAREDSTSPNIQSSLHTIPIPDFKGIPEAPEYKSARHDLPSTGGLSFPPEANPMWASNMVYPTISFTNLPTAATSSFSNHNNLSSFQCHHQFSTKASQPSLLPAPLCEAVNCEMGIGTFNPFKAWSG